MKKLPLSLKLFEMISSVPKSVSIASTAVFGFLGFAHLFYAVYVFTQNGMVKNLPYFLSSSLGCFALATIYFFIHQMSRLNQELVNKGVFIESYFEENMAEYDEEMDMNLDHMPISQSAVINIKSISKEIRSI